MNEYRKSQEVESEHIRQSTWDKVLKFIASTDIPSPYLLIDKEILSYKVSLIGKKIKNAKVFYAVKANPDTKVVQFLDDMGMDFEIASEGELGILSSLGIKGDRIISSNPVKSLRFLKEAVSYGVDRFAFDSEAEVDKLSVHAPGCRVYIRLSVPNEGSEWPLSKKYGVEIEDAIRLLKYSGHKGLVPVGITFHVGSQCLNIYSWDTALDKSKQLWEAARDSGIELRVLNIGGGYPIRYTKDVIGIEDIEEKINSSIGNRFPEDIEVHIEPGRSVVGDSGIFVSNVIGKAERGDENWLYLDVGVFNGLMESLGGIKYSYVVDNRGEMKKWTVAGPSCDSFDVMEREVELPEPLVGDTVLILSSGAYTVSYASEFNGFSVPKTILI
ncbi:MAG: type III PLP-dependent enzyme [Thermodesulfovibrionia bacterium]|nr:type III PLP-dependent enzyme [Thermodesulfovibrionia bacterium]